jgi:hypothetical protein
MIVTEETEVLGEKHYTASVVDEEMSITHMFSVKDIVNRSTWRKT